MALDRDFFALLPIAVKNIGVLYSVAVLLSFLVTAVWFSKLSAGMKWTLYACLAAVPAAALLVVCYFNWSTTWMGSEFSNDLTTRILWFGGYPLQFSYVGIVTVIRNAVHALLINQSFGVLFLAFIFSSLFAASGSSRLRRDESLHFAALATSCAVFAVAAFTLPQLVSERVNAFSAPAVDTGYSRFLVPVAMLLPVPMLVVHQRARTWFY